MAYIPRYDSGDWKAMCDVCGREYKASQLTQRWDGLMCCTQDWEPRQPQDFVRGVDDNQTVPWSRPEPADYFIPINFTPTILFQITAIPTLSLAVVKHDYTDSELINGSAINTTTLG